MSQYDFGTIDPNTKSGTALATDLNSWRTALHSQHSGSSAPAYIATGMMWADNTSADLILNMYDGTDSIPLLQLDATNNRVIWTIEDGSITGTYVEDARATYGGTANAITLTTGASLTALTTGMMLRFRATAANTGAATINVDGIGAVAAVTVTGAALPADYIRTGIETVVVYDGTNWVVSGVTSAVLEGTAKATADYDQKTPVVNASYNISSVADTGVGTFDPSFISAFADTFTTVSPSGIGGNNTNGVIGVFGTGSGALSTTGGVLYDRRVDTNALVDDIAKLAYHGDLA